MHLGCEARMQPLYHQFSNPRRFTAAFPRKVFGKRDRRAMGHRSLTSCYLLGPICSGPESSCWKSRRLRSGSQTGSIFKRAMETTWPAGMESNRRSLLMASSGAPVRASICASPFWKFGPAQSILFDGNYIRRLPRKAQSIGIAPEGEVNPR